jgi:hypothetical protein
MNGGDKLADIKPTGWEEYVRWYPQYVDKEVPEANASGKLKVYRVSRPSWKADRLFLLINGGKAL